MNTVIDAAAEVGARTVYLLTGGRSRLDVGAGRRTVLRDGRPVRSARAAGGCGLAVERASSLYADIHLAHTLRDTIALAEMAGLGICIDVFHCWAEADFEALVQRALPRTELIQLSDYVLGDHALPARAYPATARFRSRHLWPKRWPADTPTASTWS